MEIRNNAYEEHHQAAVRYERRQWQLLMLVLTLACFLAYSIAALFVSPFAIANALGMCGLGLFGLLISNKLHKRTVFHTAIKRRIRTLLEAEQSSDTPPKQPIAQLENEAAPEHYASLQPTLMWLYSIILLTGLILALVLIGLHS